MRQWKPQDVIALVLVIGLIALKCLGYDDVLSWALLGIVGAYYGVDLSPFLKLGKKKEETHESHNSPDS